MTESIGKGKVSNVSKSETTAVRRSLVGRVVSDKMEKTVTVLIERRVKHPRLEKFMTLSRKIHAHNENNQAKMGDWVEIQETKPVSKTKAWTISKLLDKP